MTRIENHKGVRYTHVDGADYNLETNNEYADRTHATYAASMNVANSLLAIGREIVDSLEGIRIAIRDKK